MIEILTVQEVAELLKLHPRTVMKMAVMHQIPATKIGRKWRFDRRLIEDWISLQMQNSKNGLDMDGTSGLPGDYLNAEKVFFLNSGATWTEVLSMLALQASRMNGGIEAEQLRFLLEEREVMFSTATESGVAFPHPRHPLPGLKAPLLVVAIVPEGVDFGAHDGSLSRVFVMICSPDDRLHLHLLALLARLFRSPDIVDDLCRCSSAEQALEVLNQAEKTAFAELHIQDRKGKS